MLKTHRAQAEEVVVQARGQSVTAAEVAQVTGMNIKSAYDALYRSSRSRSGRVVRVGPATYKTKSIAVPGSITSKIVDYVVKADRPVHVDELSRVVNHPVDKVKKLLGIIGVSGNYPIHRVNPSVAAPGPPAMDSSCEPAVGTVRQLNYVPPITTPTPITLKRVFEEVRIIRKNPLKVLIVDENQKPFLAEELEVQSRTVDYVDIDGERIEL